jgi:hypothetical protein
VVVVKKKHKKIEVSVKLWNRRLVAHRVVRAILWLPLLCLTLSCLTPNLSEILALDQHDGARDITGGPGLSFHLSTLSAAARLPTTKTVSSDPNPQSVSEPYPFLFFTPYILVILHKVICASTSAR